MTRVSELLGAKRVELNQEMLAFRFVFFFFLRNGDYCICELQIGNGRRFLKYEIIPRS